MYIFIRILYTFYKNLRNLKYYPQVYTILTNFENHNLNICITKEKMRVSILGESLQIIQNFEIKQFLAYLNKNKVCLH